MSQAQATALSATGRRKNAIAHVWITEGTGKITVNKREFENYFPTLIMQNTVLEPFVITGLNNKFDVVATCKGGGLAGQVGAIRHAISRALLQHDEELRPVLKTKSFLTRDPRMKERKKAGQPGARKNFQFSKR